MLQLPQTTSRQQSAKASAVEPDPVFALIDTHIELQSKVNSLQDELDRAEYEALEKHGRRPIALVSWRGYHIGSSELDTHRERLLGMGEIDAATIEQEFLEARAREQALTAAGTAWDKRIGLTDLRKKFDQTLGAEQRCAERLSKTIPTTPAGAGALIQHLLDDDLSPDEDFWHLTALRAAVAGLIKMTAAVPS
jgi:hypothetical protein